MQPISPIFLIYAVRASSVSPALAGILLAGAFPALPLVLGGVLKIVYDLALLLTFRHVKPPEEI